MTAGDQYESGPGDCICGTEEIDNTCPEHGVGGRLRAAVLIGKAGPMPSVELLQAALSEAISRCGPESTYTSLHDKFGHLLAIPTRPAPFAHEPGCLSAASNPTNPECRTSGCTSTLRGEREGAAFRRARVSADLSLREVAARLGISAVELGEYERSVRVPHDWHHVYGALSDNASTAVLATPEASGPSSGEASSLRSLSYELASHIAAIDSSSVAVAEYLERRLAALHAEVAALREVAHQAAFVCDHYGPKPFVVQELRKALDAASPFTRPAKGGE